MRKSSIGRRLPEREKGKENGAAVDRALSRPVTYHVSVRARRQEHLIKPTNFFIVYVLDNAPWLAAQYSFPGGQ